MTTPESSLARLRRRVRCRPGRAAAPSPVALAAFATLASAASLAAHSGPPYPIVSSQAAGRYEVAIWTDPDATDDGTAGGQFWVMLKPRGGGDVPAGTRVQVAIRATDRPGPELSAAAAPVDGAVSNQFAAVLMAHEGPFAVRVTVDGPLGPAEVRSTVDATYDLRPPPVLFVVYLLPFLVLGFFWVKVLRRRRALTRAPR